jgi:hypothetical protein
VIEETPAAYKSIDAMMAARRSAASVMNWKAAKNLVAHRPLQEAFRTVSWHSRGPYSTFISCKQSDPKFRPGNVVNRIICPGKPQRLRVGWR